MADSLILKGVRDVRNHKGDDLLFRYPQNRGSDAQHSLKRWWINGQNGTQYVKASVFDVAGMKLAVTATKSSTIRIVYADDGTFSFYNINGVDYAALFTEDFELIEYYVMPKIAGGKIMVVTPGDGASRPAPPAPPAPAPNPEPEVEVEVDPEPQPEPEAAAQPAPQPKPQPAPQPKPQPGRPSPKPPASGSQEIKQRPNVKIVLDGHLEVDGQEIKPRKGRVR